jgi:hypothetical protein
VRIVETGAVNRKETETLANNLRGRLLLAKAIGQMALATVKQRIGAMLSSSGAGDVGQAPRHNTDANGGIATAGQAPSQVSAPQDDEAAER